MRVLDKNKFYTEYQSKVRSGRVYYNFDNTVSIFEDHPDDDKVYDWVVEKVEKLKEENFSLSHENREKILALLSESKVEIPKEVIETPNFENGETYYSAVLVDNTSNICQDLKNELLEEIENKQTVASLTEIVKKVIAAL